MNRDNIIRVAREFGWSQKDIDGLLCIVETVAEAEREECAKVCEAGVVQTSNWDASDWNQACKIRAAAIRARGNK